MEEIELEILKRSKLPYSKPIHQSNPSVWSYFIILWSIAKWLF